MSIRVNELFDSDASLPATAQRRLLQRKHASARASPSRYNATPPPTRLKRRKLYMAERKAGRQKCRRANRQNRGAAVARRRSRQQVSQPASSACTSCFRKRQRYASATF